MIASFYFINEPQTQRIKKKVFVFIFCFLTIKYTKNYPFVSLQLEATSYFHTSKSPKRRLSQNQRHNMFVQTAVIC